MKFQRGKIFEHQKVRLDYDDLECNTRKSGRTYVTPTGERYPSITTVLGHSKKKYIQEWRKRVGEAEADRISHHACTRGTAVHDMIERYLKNEDNVVGSNTLPHILSSWIAIQPVLDSRMGKISMLETPLYSHHLTVAGKVDCIAEFDGKLSVVDFKTSTRIKTADEIHSYFMQEAAYAIMFEERTGTPITQLITIMMVENDPNPLIFKEHRDNWTDKLMKEIANYLIDEKTQGTKSNS